MNKYQIEVRIGYGTISYTVEASNSNEALEQVRGKLEAAGLKHYLPKDLAAFSKILQVN